MTFHEKAALHDTLTLAFKPVEDHRFAYLVGKLDGVLELSAKLDTVYRGTIVQVVK